MDGGGLWMDSLKAAVEYTCAICCDTIQNQDTDWILLKASRSGTPASQEFFVHIDCFRRVLGVCVPLGEVFE